MKPLILILLLILIALLSLVNLYCLRVEREPGVWFGEQPTRQR